jgi:hypothetical protein
MSTSNFKAYNDIGSQMFIATFRRALAPVLENIAPNHVLHHINIRRPERSDLLEEVRIELAIRPIGSVREAGHDEYQTQPIHPQLKGRS